MKRDMELVRKLLFLAEADGKDDELCEEYGQDVVAGHVAILLTGCFSDSSVDLGGA